MIEISINGRLIEDEVPDTEYANILKKDLHEAEVNGFSFDYAFDEGPRVPRMDLDKIKDNEIIVVSKRLLFEDGTIEIISQSNSSNNYKSPNFGFTGWFNPFIYVDGKRRIIKNKKQFFGSIFSYNKQNQRAKVIEWGRELLNENIGRKVFKVKGGYEIDLTDYELKYPVY